MSQPMPHLTDFVRTLSDAYERLHVAKEDAFWTAYMGLGEDADAARADFDRKEIELKRFLADPARLAEVRARLAEAEAGNAPAEVATALQGWEQTLAANVIESAEAQALVEDIIALEGSLARARSSMRLGYQTNGELVEASSVRLAVMLSNDPDAKKREAAWRGLASIEPHVLANGFVELVRKRNRLGRMLGGEDYYDWKARREGGMSKAEIFALLDELEAKTRDAAHASLEALKRARGPDATAPWNLRYSMTGDISNELDPYFPFAQSFERWGRSFAALAIRYRGAELVLDLVDRKGKYENGFCHGPVPTWRRDGVFRPARVQFTANAIPGMTGSGKRAAETLFHEGGHAAHFANVDMPAPCFSQEFAPTSVAHAETQSMFLDSLLDDADWQTRYAAVPLPLIEKAVRATQSYDAWNHRAMAAICYCERAIYEIPDEALTAERILEELRRWERKLLFVDQSPRPALSVPHLISGESSAYYHGYLLALMAVHQTRCFFIARDGHLVDNPRIGPDLARYYWQPGNAKSFPEFVADLTEQDLSPDALATHLNRTPDEAAAEAKADVARLADIPTFDGRIDLDATIRIVHGREEVASVARNGDFDAASAAFARWIEKQEASRG